MELTEVRIKLINNSSDRLKAFASVTFDGDFVVRDIKVIDGTDGVFVAMPSRKLADRCPKCGGKNHLRARFCNDCGVSLPRDRSLPDRRGRTKLHADIAHPINSECRHRLQDRIVEAFHLEMEQAKRPDYKPLSDEEYEDTGGEFEAEFDEEEEIDDDAELDDDTDDDDDDEGDDEDTDADLDDDSDLDDDFGDDDEAIEKEVQKKSTVRGRTDYDSLIDDLKRDAAGRREQHFGSKPPQARRESAPAPTRHRPEPDRAPAGATSDQGRRSDRREPDRTSRGPDRPSREPDRPSREQQSDRTRPPREGRSDRDKPSRDERPDRQRPLREDRPDRERSSQPDRGSEDRPRRERERVTASGPPEPARKPEPREPAKTGGEPAEGDDFGEGLV